MSLEVADSVLVKDDPLDPQQRAQGTPFMEAVINSAIIRLRPILMTSFATIFGILPIAIGLGAGAESRRPLGLAVVGGMFFSTFLTLLIVPVVYTLLARFTGTKQPAEQVDEKSTKPESGTEGLITEGAAE